LRHLPHTRIIVPLLPDEPKALVHTILDQAIGDSYIRPDVPKTPAGTTTLADICLSEKSQKRLDIEKEHP